MLTEVDKSEFDNVVRQRDIVIKELTENIDKLLIIEYYRSDNIVAQFELDEQGVKYLIQQ